MLASIAYRSWLAQTSAPPRSTETERSEYRPIDKRAARANSAAANNCKLASPLQVDVEVDVNPMGFGEAGNGQRLRVTVFRWPDRPTPDRWIARVQMLLQRLERRLPMKGPPAGFDETLECACALGPLPKMMLVEMAMQRSQYLELDLRHCRVIDPLAGAQRL